MAVFPEVRSHALIQLVFRVVRRNIVDIELTAWEDSRQDCVCKTDQIQPRNDNLNKGHTCTRSRHSFLQPRYRVLLYCCKPIRLCKGGSEIYRNTPRFVHPSGSFNGGAPPPAKQPSSHTTPSVCNRDRPPSPTCSYCQQRSTLEIRTPLRPLSSSLDIRDRITPPRPSQKSPRSWMVAILPSARGSRGSLMGSVGT